MRGKSDGLTVIVRLVPRISGLLVQLGPANAAKAPASKQPLVTATPTSFEILPNFNMSFCSGIGLEGAAIYLFTGQWYGDVGLNITAVRDARPRSAKMENKKGECRAGSALTNVTTKWEPAIRPKTKRY
jgi:hypothetical protein